MYSCIYKLGRYIRADVWFHMDAGTGAGRSNARAGPEYATSLLPAGATGAKGGGKRGGRRPRVEEALDSAGKKGYDRGGFARFQVGAPQALARYGVSGWWHDVCVHVYKH